MMDVIRKKLYKNSITQTFFKIIVIIKVKKNIYEKAIKSEHFLDLMKRI